ncbi:hypothetical protein NECAME_18488 [Necator americanus]|uniref:Uncharacterized protein n=1 Tax=Necator americanus TaxID=51031 RepID=W2SWT8_NECAM|nr:hypothetical protein NECAME_18488 [Necator americanus]ETN73167.1 hypothetical protein NECAME_18488 [Necator americanus]
MMPARMNKHKVIGQTRRSHLLNAIYDTGDFEIRDNRGVSGVSISVNSMAENNDCLEKFTTRSGRFRTKKCGLTPALIIFFSYSPTPSYDEEDVEAFSMGPEMFYKEGYTFHMVIVGDFNAKIGPKRTIE